MTAQVTIHLVEKMCEHCPSQDDAWGWSLEIVGNQVVLVVRCKVCDAQLVYTERQMHGRLSYDVPRTSHIAEAVANVAGTDQDTATTPPEPERREPRPLSFTPGDRAFLKKLKISIDGMEFDK